jgi:aminopeptidase YwaD
MNQDNYVAKARLYLNTLCAVKPNRRTGSPGNRQATDFFAAAIGAFGYEIDTTLFDCLDYVNEGAALTVGSADFEVFTSP